MSEYSKWFWSECDQLSKDTSFAHNLAEKSWDYQQAKIDALEVQLKGAEERAKLTLDHKNRMVDELQEQLRIEREQGTDYFTDFHNAIAQRDELQARVDKVVHILTYTNHASTPLCNELCDILKGNKYEK